MLHLWILTKGLIKQTALTAQCCECCFSSFSLDARTHTQTVFLPFSLLYVFFYFYYNLLFNLFVFQFYLPSFCAVFLFLFYQHNFIYLSSSVLLNCAITFILETQTNLIWADLRLSCGLWVKVEQVEGAAGSSWASWVVPPARCSCPSWHTAG